MNIRDFFDLPESERQFIIDLHNKQKKIRLTREAISDDRQKLVTREFNNQQQCEHPFATEKYHAHENEFGNLTGGGWYEYRCDDCGYGWTEEKQR